MKRASVLSVALLVALLIHLPAFGESQPNMHEAIDDLRRAQTSHSIDDLKAAKLRLEHGKHKKAGFRADALKLVEKAIQAENAGDRIGAGKIMGEAIAMLDKAVAAGHK